jgi:hypothetical protein
MKKNNMAIAALMAAAILGSEAWGESWKGDANLLFAGKTLDSGDWTPTNHQGEIGVVTNWRRSDWPVALAADLLAAGRDETISQGGFTDQKASTSELDLGVRKIWREETPIRPYIGGGFGIMSGEIKRTGPAGTVSDHDGGLGIWFDGGVVWTLRKALNLGVDVRISNAHIRLLGQDRNAGGAHLGLTAGYHWGG